MNLIILICIIIINIIAIDVILVKCPKLYDRIEYVFYMVVIDMVFIAKVSWIQFYLNSV